MHHFNNTHKSVTEQIHKRIICFAMLNFLFSIFSNSKILPWLKTKFELENTFVQSCLQDEILMFLYELCIFLYIYMSSYCITIAYFLQKKTMQSKSYERNIIS